MWLCLYEETDAENVKTDMEIFGFNLFFLKNIFNDRNKNEILCLHRINNDYKNTWDDGVCPRV